jgi:L-lysine 6-transaminase
MEWTPGPKSKELLDEFRDYVVMEPRPYVIDLERCEGMHIVTIDGQRIFDWAGYYGSKLIAHNHPRLQEPDYLKRLARAANNKVANPDYVTPELVEYYRLLHRIGPTCMKNPELEVFTVNSGAEAVENALKYMVKLYHEKTCSDRKVPRYSSTPGFIHFEQGFHGRTVYALNVTDMPHNPIVTKDFHGLAPKNVMVPFPENHSDAEVGRCLRAVEEALQFNGFNIAGIIIEPMQSAGGQRTAPKHFFQRLSQLAHDWNVGLCFDEVQTTGGPCGSIFMCDQFDLPHSPDVVVTAKKFACGVVYMKRPMQDKGILDSTWSGTLADMVRFVQEWKIVEEEGLLDQVADKAQHLCYGLEHLAKRYPDLVSNVCGAGLYQGFTIHKPLTRKNFVDAALARHSLLLMGAGTDSVRLRPNLSVTHEDIDSLLSLLSNLLDDHRTFTA